MSEYNEYNDNCDYIITRIVICFSLENFTLILFYGLETYN